MGDSAGRRDAVETLVDDLEQTLKALVGAYGLSNVHETLREIGRYCENCGCPLEHGETHSPFGSMGSCWIQRTIYDEAEDAH
jgi:hypothetical protein